MATRPFNWVLAQPLEDELCDAPYERIPASSRSLERFKCRVCNTVSNRQTYYRQCQPWHVSEGRLVLGKRHREASVVAPLGVNVEECVFEDALLQGATSVDGGGCGEESVRQVALQVDPPPLSRGRPLSPSPDQRHPPLSPSQGTQPFSSLGTSVEDVSLSSSPESRIHSLSDVTEGGNDPISSRGGSFSNPSTVSLSPDISTQIDFVGGQEEDIRLSETEAHLRAHQLAQQDGWQDCFAETHATEVLEFSGPLKGRVFDLYEGLCKPLASGHWMTVGDICVTKLHIREVSYLALNINISPRLHSPTASTFCSHRSVPAPAASTGRCHLLLPPAGPRAYCSHWPLPPSAPT